MPEIATDEKQTVYETQSAEVLRLLRESGAYGLSSCAFAAEHHRYLSPIIGNLRKRGYKIQSYVTAGERWAEYVLTGFRDEVWITPEHMRKYHPLTVEERGWTPQGITERWAKATAFKDATLLIVFRFPEENAANSARSECLSYGWHVNVASASRKSYQFTAMVPIHDSIASINSDFTCWYNSNEGAWVSVAERHNGRVHDYTLLEGASAKHQEKNQND